MDTRYLVALILILVIFLAILFFLVREDHPVAGEVFDPTELCVNPFRHHGYLTVDEATNTKLFYLFFEAKDPNAPLLLWTNGGPGASSMNLALLLGPYNIVDEQHIKMNPYPWTDFFHMLFIDHPAPVGFSVTDQERPRGDPNAGEQDAEELMTALDVFFQGDGRRFQGNDFYIGGVSYGGHYMPRLAVHIMNAGNPFNLKGMLLHSPYFDIETTLKYQGRINYLTGRYTDTFYNNRVLPFHSQVQVLLDQGDFVNASLLSYAFIADASQHFHGSFFNVYRHSFTSLSTPFFNNPNIQKLLDVDMEWAPTNQTALFWLAYDFAISIRDQMEHLLQNYPDLRIHVAHGDFDVGVPALGSREWLKSLTWSGQEAFNEEMTLWFLEPDVAGGFFQQAQNLTYAEIFYAPHGIVNNTPRQGYVTAAHFAKNLSYNHIIPVADVFPDCYVINRPVADDDEM